MCLSDCSSSDVAVTANNRQVVSSLETSLTVGDILSCSTEDALSYRWTNVNNGSESVTYGKSFAISQPGIFNYSCTVYTECSTGEDNDVVMCALTRNVSGVARGLWNARLMFLQLPWLVWRTGNGVRHTKKVKLRRSRSVLGLVSFSGSLSRPLSLPIALWVDAMTMVSATAGEETASCAYQWALLPALMAYWIFVC